MAFKISDYLNQHKDYYGDSSLEDVAKDIYDRGGHANQYKDFETFKKTTGIDSEIQADNEKRRPKSFMDKLSDGVASVAPGFEEIPKGLKAGVQQVRGMGYGLGSLAGEVTGAEGLKKWGAEGLKDVEAKTPKAAVGSFSEIESISDLGKYLAYGVSSNLPNMAVSLATGGVGGLAGKTLAKGAIEKATAGIVEKEVAKKVAQDVAKKYLTRGAVAGAATSSIGMEAGSIAGDQLNETGKVDPLRAMAGAIPAGLLDVVPEWYLAKKLGWVGKGATEFKGNLPTRIAKVAGAQFAMEAPTEAVQSAIERASVPGKSLTNAEAWDEYINSFILGGVTGGVVGAAGGVFAKGEQQKETRETKKTALSNTIDEGLKNGKLGEEVFTPGKALGIIKAGLDEGIFSAEDISKFRKYEKDHPEFKTGLDTISDHAAKNELNMVIDTGIKNGNIGGTDVSPDDVLGIIAEYHGKGLYTDDDLSNFKEQYPILKAGLNDVLVESAKKKVNDDVPLYLGPEDAAEQSARAREAFTNAAGQRLLPPGQGFTFKDVDYGIPVGEPYGEPDVIDVPSVSREIRGLPYAEPLKQLPPGQGFELGGTSDIFYPDEFTRKLAESPEMKAVAPMASIGQESEGSASASGIEPGGNLEKAPHSLTYTAVKGNSVFDNVQPGNVEQLRSMGYEITENKSAIADVPGAQAVTPSPVTAEAAENTPSKVERRGQAEKTAFIRNEVEINSVKARMSGGKPDTAQLVKDAEKRWGQNQSSEAAKQANIPAEQPTAEKTEVNSGNLPGQKEIVQPGASSQAAPEMPANQGIAEVKTKEPWEMTKAEYLKSAPREKNTTDAYLSGYHSSQVRMAIKQGDPVPPEVLKDYPELVKNQNKKPPESDEIFIRAAERKDLGKASKSLKAIPDKEGYEKVYKKDEKGGRGFYYVKVKQKNQETFAGTKTVAQRIVNGENAFIAAVQEQFGKTKEEAERVLQRFIKEKLVKIDPVMGQFNIKHGAVWEKDVIDRAAEPEHIKESVKKSTKAKQNPAKGAQNLVTRILELGGLKVTGKDYNTRLLRQDPDAKRVLRMKSGLTADQLASRLQADGWEIESGDHLVELLKSGQGRTTYAPEIVDEKLNRQAERETNEWAEQQARELEAAARLAAEGIDARAIAESKGDIIAGATETVGSEGLTSEVIEANAGEVDSFFDDIIQANKQAQVKQTEVASQKEKQTPKGEFKNSELEGFGLKDTFGLLNPETDMSQHKPLSERAIVKNEGLFDIASERSYNVFEEDNSHESKVSDTGSRGIVQSNTGRGAGVQYQPTVVRQEKVGSIEAKSRTITSSYDAAQLAHSYLKKFPDEHLLSLVIGKGGKLLHVYRHTIGTRGQSQASQSTIIGEALNTPGAESIIIAHNHPSQQAKTSPEDNKFYDQLKNLAYGSGLAVRDSLVVTADSYISYEETGGYGARPINTENGKIKIPLIGRVFEVIRNGEKVTDAGTALDAARKHIPSGGTLLLDGANNVAGVINISNYQKTRGEAQKELLQELEKRNARAIIVYSPDRIIESDEAKNIQKFSNATGREIRLLDIIDSQGSKANDGYMPLTENDAVFYARKDNKSAGDGDVKYRRDAWHGSPYTFDAFSVNKIGSGEGAQAYGYGLYFASSKEVGEFYKNQLAPEPELTRWYVGTLNLFGSQGYVDYSPRDNSASSIAKSVLSEDLLIEERTIMDAFAKDGKEGVKREILRVIDERISSSEEESPAYLTTLKLIRNRVEANGFRFDAKIEKGRLYEVELAPDEDEYLLWDKPLSEQSEKVKEALKAAVKKLDPVQQKRIADEPTKASGAFIYKNLSIDIGAMKSQGWAGINDERVASEYLHSLGIRGIKYLDGTSRGKGEGAYNYVIFSDDDVAIKAMYNRRKISTRGISTDRVQSIVDKVASTFNINPKIHVIQHISECPDAVLKDMERKGILDENGDADVQGFAWRGETWLVGDNLDSDVEAFKVLMHELTHNGLGALLNDNSNLKSVQWQYNNLMDKIISAHRRDIMTIARTTHTHLNLNTIEGRRQAAEEWLCNQSYEAQHKWYDKLITIFNNLVRAMGLDIKLSDSEVRIILREAFQTFEGRNDDVRYMVAAWHGSQGQFDKFSSQKIKTGNYGHGLYFSSMREVAEQYKEGGHLYQVTLAPDESDFLDWDRPINKQSKYIQDVLNNSAIRDALDSYEDAGGYVDTGKDVYFALMKEQGSAKAASQLLNDYGIAGNKYIDSTQGNIGQNYVLFDDQDVNIEARYARSGRILGEEKSNAFAKQLDDYVTGKLKPRIPVTIGETPYVLERLGAKQLPLVITQNTLKKVMEDKHGLSLEILKQLPSHLADPVMVFDSATESDSLVVMTELKKDGKTIIAAIHLSKEMGKNIVNDIASVYPRQNEYHFINWIERGLLRYMNKKKSQAWSKASRLQLPGVTGSIQGSKSKILFDYDLVKRNPSDDSERGPNYALEDGILRTDGVPQTFYRGTKAETSTAPFFFSDSKKAANRYGKVQEVNLQMRNPKEIDYNGKEDNDLVFDIEEAQEQGHDGLIARDTFDGWNTHTQYIVFNKDQIKTPGDVKYSIRKPQDPPVSSDPIIKQREIGKGEEKRTAPAVHQSDFETLQAMPELRVKPLGGWLENPIRTFEELGKDVKELFYRPVKEAEHKAKIEFKAINEQVEKLQKSLPGKSSERIGIYALAQQKDGKEILASMKITEVPKLDTKEMEAYEWMRENLEEFYEKLQTAREAAGKEGFGKVENYFTFARQFSLAEKLGFSPIFTRSELLNTVMHRKTTSFKYEKHRTGGMSRADLDAFGVFNRYMESATRHVALSPAIAKGREMLLTFKVPGPAGEEANWLLRDEKPAAAKFITEWLDFQAGQRKPQLPNLIEKGLTTLNKNLAFAILSANIRSALIQPSAIVNTFAEIGPKWTFEGIKGMMDGSIINKSNVLLSRQFDVNISETMAGLPGKFGRVKQAIGNIGMKPLQFLDMMTARATWQGAYKKALSEGIDEGTAINYADDVVTRTQGSAMPSDMAPVQRTALGKSVTMFQTFVINQWGFLTKDVLGINNAQISKKEAARKIITFIALAILFNMFYEDLLEVPAPLPSPISAFIKALDKGESMPSASADAAREIASIVPIIGGGLRYGSSPLGAPVEYVTDIFKKMSPNYSGPTRSVPELIGKGLGIPGTTQATKITRVEKKGGSILDMALGRYDTENDPRQIKKSLVRRLRNKDAAALADMRKYYQEGKLTKKEIKAIRDEASVPEIVWKFKRLSLDEAIEEYKSASAEEKKLLRPVLKSKMHLLSELAPEPRKKKVMELKEALAS